MIANRKKSDAYHAKFKWEASKKQTNLPFIAHIKHEFSPILYLRMVDLKAS